MALTKEEFGKTLTYKVTATPMLIQQDLVVLREFDRYYEGLKSRWTTILIISAVVMVLGFILGVVLAANFNTPFGFVLAGIVFVIALFNIKEIIGDLKCKTNIMSIQCKSN